MEEELEQMLEEEEETDPLAIKFEEIIQTLDDPETFQRIMDLEAEILASESFIDISQTCTSMKDVKEPYGIKLIHENSRIQIYNGTLFRWLMCSFDEAFILKKQGGGSGKTTQNIGPSPMQISPQRPASSTSPKTIPLPQKRANIGNIRDVINHLNLLTNSGVYGDLWKANVKGVEDFMVIKTYKNGFDEYGIKEDQNMHEYFIGYFLNKLRYQIPNFMYVFGLFTCNRPVGGEVCPEPDVLDLRDYLLLENIDGVTLQSFIESRYAMVSQIPSLKQQLYSVENYEIFMGIYLQIFFALSIAYDALDFTHYDLHDENVLIQDLGEPYYIEYKFRLMNDPNGTPFYQTYYIKTRYLAKIIDYGQAHIRLKVGSEPRGFGNFEHEGFYGKSALRSNPLYDMFMFTGWFLYDIQRFDKALFNEMSYLVVNFPPSKNSSDLLDNVLSEKKSGFVYILDPIESVPDDFFQEHLKHIMQFKRHLLFGKVIFDGRNLPADRKIFNCSSLTCSNWQNLEVMANTEVGSGKVEVVRKKEVDKPESDVKSKRR